MATERELMQIRAKLLEESKELTLLAKKNRDEGIPSAEWTPEWEERYEKWETDSSLNDKEIRLVQKQSNFEKTLIDNTEIEAEDRAQKGDHSYKDAFNAYLRSGYSGLSEEARSLLSGNEVTNSEKRGTSTLIAGTDTLGGFRIPDIWSATFYEYLLYYGPMMEAADVFRTSGGGKFIIPNANDTGTSATQTAEGNVPTIQDYTFAEFTLNDYTAASLVKASMQQVDDDVYDLGGYIAKNSGIRIGRQVNTKLTTGTGSSQANGVVTAAGAGKTTASATAIIRDEVIDLLHSVDVAYRKSPKCGFMMHDLIMAYIKKLTVGSADDRPLWQPSIREGEPDKLEGFRYWINNDMASTVASTNITMLFGDFDAYKVRTIGSVGTKQLTERFMDALTYGYISWLRYDGDLIDNTAVKKLTQLT